MIVQANLYQGDCIEIMRGIPDESIDMILCPMGQLKMHGIHLFHSMLYGRLTGGL